MPLARHRMQRSDFVRAYAQGRRARGGSFSVVVLENGLPHARLGLSVSKRNARQAVHRNRVRRVFREAFRLALAELPPGIDVVMVATEPGLRPRLAETRTTLLALVARALAKPARVPKSTGGDRRTDRTEPPAGP
jgi:ribonuclease P protein component